MKQAKLSLNCNLEDIWPPPALGPSSESLSTPTCIEKTSFPALETLSADNAYPKWYNIFGIAELQSANPHRNGNQARACVAMHVIT